MCCCWAVAAVVVVEVAQVAQGKGMAAVAVLAHWLVLLARQRFILRLVLTLWMLVLAVAELLLVVMKVLLRT